jgi:hypothetical protein
MSDKELLRDLDLAIRHFVYHHFALETRPPSVVETAEAFGLAEEQARAAYERLDHNHFFFLDPGTTNIRMANPFSAIPAQFTVRVGQKSYWANCAWDMLGIPAALQEDATITAEYEDTLETVVMEVKDGQVVHGGGLVHFPLPARQWYDDLILT